MAAEFSYLPEQIRNMDMVLLSDWNKYFAYPKLDSFRQMIWQSKNAPVDKYNGLHKVTRNLAGRVYVKVSAFFEWLENQNKQDIA